MDRPGSPGQQARRSTAVRTSNVALRRYRRPPRWHHGGRREPLRAATLRPSAANWQPTKAAALAASDSLLPRTGCSLRSGCSMDERHGAGTHSSTLRARGRAGKLTQVSFAVAQHGAAVPGCVHARSYPSSARSATLLQARRLAPPLLLERLVRFKSDLNSYSERLAAAIGIQVCSLDSNGRTSERERNADLTQINRKRQICATYHRT